MTDIPTIRRRRDGSIDTDYYIETGRCRRSFAAHGMASSALREIRRLLVGPNGFLAILKRFGGQGREASVDDAGT